MRMMLAASGTSDNSALVLVWVCFGLLLFIGYWLPSAVAFSRKVPNKGSIVIVNAFLGWTLIGWVVAMAMAVRDRSAGHQQIVYVQAPLPPQADPTSDTPNS